MVYEEQKEILTNLKGELPGPSTIIYFSDGCAGQYKNWKKFYNLCQRKRDFGLNASWVCFANSHGKQPCDGIAVKPLVSKASLKRDLKDQILSPVIYFNFARKIFRILSSNLLPRLTLITQG